MDEINKTLDELYNNPESPAAFAGLEGLYREARKKLGSKITKKDVDYYLQGHRTYTLMRPRRVHFKRAKTIPLGFMSDVQTDLAEMGALSRSNQGYRYILIAIDVLSKRLFAIPVKTKKAEDMLEAFKTILDQMPFKPIRIYSDLGTEYRNKLLKDFFEHEEIQKFETSSSFVKASLAERAIRNLKQRLYRYFAQAKTLNWIDVLQKIVNGINHAPSRTHGMRPIDVNFKNAQQVWEQQYGGELSLKNRHGSKKPKFMPGDTVRMSRGKHIFEKGYIPSWGDVLKGVWRFFLPLIRRVGTTVGEEALNTGQRVMEKLHEGQPLKEAVISEGKKGIDAVLDKGGFPKQFGAGKKRIKRARPGQTSQSLLNHQTIIGRTITKPLAHSKKRLRSDAFGLY